MINQKTIAFISDAIYPYNKGGKETRLYEISTRLAKQGFDVHIYCMKWWSGKADRIENGVHLHGICPLIPLYDGPRRSIKEGIIFGLACFKLITAKFDVADVDHMPFFPLYSMRIVCWLKGKKMIGTWHEVWGMKYWKEYLGTFKGTIAGLIEKISLLFPDEIVSVSPLTTDKLMKMGFAKPIITIPNGIDFQKIQSVKASKTKSDVIYAGRFLSHKNLNVLIDAIAEVKKTFPNIKCLLIGDGPEKEKLSSQIENLNLMKNVILMPFEEEISDLYALMKSSKVFVLPSTREGFGMVVLEANACGLPVITTNHPDNAAKNLITKKNGKVIKLNSKELATSIHLSRNKFNAELPLILFAEFDWDYLLTKLSKQYAFKSSRMSSKMTNKADKISRKKLRFPILRVFSILFLLTLLIASIYIKRSYDAQKEFLGQILHAPSNVLGASTSPISLNVDFSTQIAVGSPLVFGGASNPDVNDQKAWDLLASVGVTSIRRDFWIETELPTKISLDDYRNNVNNVQNPVNWNWTQGWNNISTVNRSFQNAQKRGMKTIAILSYSPAWLTYSGTEHGVPKDWTVYRDIVKKLYKIHRPYIDMMEVWNEPTYSNFLVLTNSPYRTRAEAYKDLYINATQAINEVDSEINDGKKMNFISVVGHTPMDTSVALELLSSPKTAQTITAVSYHNYHIPEPSNMYYLDVMKKLGKGNLPLYLTEWNYSPENKANPYESTNLAIAFTGKKLVGFLNEGLAGANYFRMNVNDPTQKDTVASAFGFYRLDNNKQPYLLPQGKTWQLLSKSLGLGSGESKIFLTSEPPSLAMTAFQNSANQKGVAIVNDSNFDQSVSVPLNMLAANDWDTVKIYAASSTEDGKIPCILELQQNTSGKSIWVSLPAQSVVGITVNGLQKNATALVKKIFGTPPSRTCAILK